jgi:F0F1-type ATP synthase assembly protein I
MKIPIILLLLFIPAFCEDEAYPFESSIPSNMKPALHFISAGLVSLGCGYLATRILDRTRLSRPSRIIVGALVGLSAGVGVTLAKEALDIHTRSYATFGWDDFGMGLGGSVTGTVVEVGLYLIIRRNK